MKPVFYQSNVYMFLYLCEYYNVGKSVLDCGAGGPMPPLFIFSEHNYIVSGIDISDESILLSQSFQKDNNVDLNIIKGDMRKLPYSNETFGCAFSYSTIFHMMKTDVESALKEMTRVLKKKGIMYFNLLSTKSDALGMGNDIGNNEIEQVEPDEVILHSYYDDCEIDEYLKSIGLTIIKKIIRSSQTPQISSFLSVYIDYIVQKVE